MSQPIAYSPAYNFTSFQTASPSTPLPADKLDTELQALKITTDSVRVNMALLQADDGTLKVLTVTPVSLSAATLALLTSVGVPRGAWLTATAYAAKDVVTQAGGTYICVTAHTSGTFATDLTAVKWILLAGSSGTVALSTLSDTTITTPSTNQGLYYNGTKWVNGFLVNANITAGTITFASMAAAFSITDTGLVGASNTNVPTTTAVKAYIDAQISRGTASPIASAGTTSLTGTTFNYAHITGTTAITAITLATDEECDVVFDGALTLTHNGTSLILPSAANITTAAGDRAKFRGIDGTNVICLNYVKANGQAVVGGGRVLLSSQTASASSDIHFTSGIDGTYTRYEIEISNLTMTTTGSDLKAQFFQSAAYLTGANYKGGNTAQLNGWGSNGGSVFTGKTSLDIGTTLSGITSSTTQPISVVLEFTTPTASMVCMAMWRMWGDFTNGLGYMTGAGGYDGSIGGFTGIKFIASASTIATGTFKLYGIP